MSDIGITLRGNHSGLNASLQQAGGAVKKFGDDATRSLRGVETQTRNLHKTLSALGGQMGTALTAAFAVNKIGEFTHAIIDAQTNLDKLQNTLSFSLGAGQVTGQMEYLRKTTNALGLEFGSTAVMYAKFAAAARGTSMEGRNTQKVFESIGKASTVMGLSAADTQGVMLALTQILSKGSVQAEEIRGQLGERLPGAFAIASRAMGVTTQEFSKMLELGQVVSADFLPKFANQMEKEVAGSFDKASQSMQASLNRMGNAWLEFKQTVASSGVATAIAGEINGISNYMAVLTEAMQNARASGSGAIGELSSVLGTMIARAPFDVLAFSANTLNGTLNMLSLGALKLNTNVDTLPGVFDTAAQRAAALDTNLLAAEKDLAQLRAKLDQVPDNIYLKSETHQAWLLVQELRAAKAAKDGLSGNTGPGNVSGIAAQYPTRSQSYAADAERVNKIRAGYEAVQQGLSGVSTSYLKSLAALKAGFDEGLTTQEQYTKDVIALIDKETGFKKTAAKAQSDAAKAQEDARKAAAKAEADWQAEVFKAAESEFDARERSIKTLKDQIAKETAHTAALGLSKEAMADLEVATLLETAAAKEQLATRADQIDWSGQMGDKYREEARLLRELAAAKKAGGVRASELESEREAKKYADDMLKEQKRAAEASEKYWTDALMRAFESGKGFFASLWDTIKNTLKTQVLKVLVSATGLTGMTAAGAGELGGSGGGLNLLGTAANLGKMYDTITGGFSGLADSVAFAANDMGAWLVNNTSGMLNQAGSALMQSAGTFGTVAGYAAGAAAGLAIGSAISGKYGSSGVVTAGTAIGAIFGGPIGGAIGGAIGGLVNRAFGRGPTELTASGTRGTFSGDSFSGSNYASYKKDGGWFRSDKNWTDVTAMDPATLSAWSSAFAGVKGSVAGMAASLGLATDKISAYSKAVDIAAGTTQEQITAIFTGMADDMATAAAPAIAAFGKSGETASVTLQRLSGSLTTANAWLSMLRNRLFDISLSGADAASKLADAFGSLDNLAASSKAYYDLFYTEAERTAISSENLAKAMALVGVALPDTMDAFRAVVSGLDLTTDAGRNSYAVMLMLAPEFAAMSAAAEKMATDTAAALIKTFTGNGQLVPVLDAAALRMGNVASGAGSMTTALAYINTIMGDSSSGVITLGGNISTLGTGMTASQTSAALLTSQIQALALNADKTRIDFNGLGVALLGVNPSLVGTSINQANAYLAGINPLPVGVSMADVSRYLTAINTLPVNASIFQVNTALGAINPALVGYSIEQANRLLRGLDPMPVGVTVDDINFFLQRVNAAPILYAVDDINLALRGVNTATFVATITSVFENLATRIGSVIDSITTERIAVREAALQIINPTVMSKDAIARSIASINTGLPSNAGVVAANSTLAAADANLANVSKLVSSQTAVSQALTTSTNKLATDQTYYLNKAAQSQAILVKYGAATAVAAYTFSTATNRATWNSAGYAPRDGVVQAQTIAEERGNAGDWQAWFNYLQYGAARPATNAESPWTALDGANAIMAATERAIAEQKATLAQITTALGGATLAGATSTQTAAQAAAQKAALDYAAALQTFAIDASKSVTKLSRLREETVKYYDAQKALADLMGTSAAGLRSTVANYRFGTLSESDQLASLQSQFSAAYSTALATQGDGATLASYGDKVNSLLSPLIELLNSTGKTSLIGNYLAQAESVAALIEAATPVNYQQDSLNLLGSIDATLAALEASSLSAEAIISNAVAAGANRTAVGLKTIGEAISGKTIPAFAGGGYHAGGMRLVGENGPELEVTGPSRIFNASQTRGMLGGNGRLEALVERQAKQLEAMSFELRAIAQTNARLAKLAERAEQEGTLVRTDADTPLQVETV